MTSWTIRPAPRSCDGPNQIQRMVIARGLPGAPSARRGRFTGMADITIFHNPNCSSSRGATEMADELGIDVDIRRYQLKAERPTVEELRELLAILEDPPTALVRRDATFAKLGLADADVQSVEQVAVALAAHPELIQRPVLVAEGSAIIGRPKDRIAPFLAAHS